VAKVERDNIVVGLQSVPADSPVGRLRGSDNLVVFESDRYADRPLVVSGPGAGVEVTAMGVLGDLLRIVGERR
jgi:homoserine dehydrogenase